MKMMRKMVLIPYDKYERLLTGQVSQPEPVNTTDTYTEQVTLHNPQQDYCHSNTQDSIHEDLLSSLPLPLRSRAKVILNHLAKHTNLQWNDKGEIIVNGKVVTGSNINDLIKIQLKDYRSFHPVGAEVFSQLVQESNVPQSVLQKYYLLLHQYCKSEPIRPYYVKPHGVVMYDLADCDDPNAFYGLRLFHQ